MPVLVLVTASQQVLSSEQDSTVLALSVPRAKGQSLPQCLWYERADKELGPAGSRS